MQREYSCLPKGDAQDGRDVSGSNRTPAASRGSSERPGWNALASRSENVVLHLKRKLVGVVIRAAASIGQPFQTALLMALETGYGVK